MEAMKAKKRLFAVLISMLLVLAMMPALAFAEIEGGSHEVEVDASAGDQTLNRGAISSTTQSALGVIAINGYSATVNIDGAVTTDKYVGARLFAGSAESGTSGTTAVTVKGVSAPYGVMAEAAMEGSALTFTSKGDIAGTSNYGMNLSAKGGRVDAAVDGNVAAKGTAVMIDASGGSISDILVTGTIKGYNALSITYGAISGTTLTSWKIEEDGGSFITSSGYADENDRERFAKEDINYIAKSSDDVTLLRENGSALATSHGYPVAKEGEKILIKAANGNAVTKAYNGGIEITTKTADGTYYYTVPRGGGIDITADIGDTPAPPVHVHSLTKVDRVDPTCTAAGTAEYWKCTGCNKLFADADAAEEIAAPAVIAKLGHSMKTVTNKAGLLKNGSTYQQCTRCGIKTKVKVLPGWSNSYVKSLKLAKAKKAFTVKWKKQTGKNLKQFDGYQIRYSLKKNMSAAKTVNVKKTAASRKIKGNAKTTYYVQVRTYKTVKGVKYYSAWTKTKSVKTK